jgi:predicted RNA binding protein YcfA (HicA-like mRNA interferase family)
MKARELIRDHVEASGGVLERKDGDHHVYRLPNGRLFAVPVGGRSAEAKPYLLHKLRRVLREPRIAAVAVVASVVAGCGAPFVNAAEDAGGAEAQVAALDSGATDSGATALDRRTSVPPEVGPDGQGAADADAGQAREAAVTRPDAGGADAGDAGAPVDSGSTQCADDLSHVGAGDFRVTFDVLATSVESDGPLVEQRATCGQYDPHWLVAIAAGHVVAQTYDGSAGATLQSVGTVNDGARHRVAVARVAGTLSIAVDGVVDTSEPNAVFAPGALPAMQVGRSACASPYSGQVTNACAVRQ